MEELKEKRERFCQEYVIDRNGTQAAIRAGYAAKGAHVEASRLMKDVYVSRRIKELEREALEAAGYSPETMRAYIIRQALAHVSVDATDVAEIVYPDDQKRLYALEEMAKENGGQYYLDFGEPVVYLKPTKEYSPDERAAVKGIKQTRTKEGVVIDVQMHDKHAALKLLADIAGITKADVSVNLSVVDAIAEARARAAEAAGGVTGDWSYPTNPTNE